MSLDLHAAAPPEPGAPRSARHTRRRAASMTRLDLKYSPYLYVLPFFVIFAVFGVYPIAYTVWIALTDRSPLNPTISFVGMDNFVELITEDPQFWNAVVNTFGMFALSTVPQLLLALMLANALNRKLRAQTFFRMAIAMPIITSTAVVALIFSMLYAKDFGLVNWLLDSIGLDPIDWRANRFASWFAISTMVDWRWVGYNALIYLAAMQSISKDMYEAAALDGASRRRQFWSDHGPAAAPHDHLHADHLHHRRPSAVHRAAAVHQRLGRSLRWFGGAVPDHHDVPARRDEPALPVGVRRSGRARALRAHRVDVGDQLPARPPHQLRQVR